MKLYNNTLNKFLAVMGFWSRLMSNDKGKTAKEKSMKIEIKKYDFTQPSDFIEIANGIPRAKLDNVIACFEAEYQDQSVKMRNIIAKNKKKLKEEKA